MNDIFKKVLEQIATHGLSFLILAAVAGYAIYQLDQKNSKLDLAAEKLQQCERETREALIEATAALRNNTSVLQAITEEK